MASYINIILDTNSPANPSLSINGGSTFATNQLVNLSIGTSDAVTTGYQMKIWGDVDETYDTSIKKAEADSQWMSFASMKQIKLSTGDGLKPINLRIRDDVYNESSVASDDITLDTALPSVNVGSPDVNKISKKAGKDAVSFTFNSATTFTEYKVKFVSSAGAIESAGVQIPTTAGSTNVQGTGTFNSPITVTIKGADLQTASNSDGNKIIKVFVKNQAGTWSV